MHKSTGKCINIYTVQKNRRRKVLALALFAKCYISSSGKLITGINYNVQFHKISILVQPKGWNLLGVGGGLPSVG